VTTFERRGFATRGITRFDSALEEILSASPDLLILDVNLPGSSGYTLCRQLKTRVTFPILILTSRDTIEDEITALGLGADDFLPKPCQPERLIARVERLLQMYRNVPAYLKAADLLYDPDAYKLMRDESFVILTETEGNILRVLLENYGETIPTQSLIIQVWGDADHVDENILSVNLTRLRKSLDVVGVRSYLQNDRGRGYRFTGDTA